jgi:hypothetical protein
MTYTAVAGKPGYEADAALVTAELSNLPRTIGDSIVACGIGLVACRGNVTDYAPQLHNQTPRNWPPGSTWDIVPGAYIPDLQKVVVATQPTPGGGWHVPVYGELEGSRSITIHESMHAYDYEDDQRKSSDPAFLAARQADFALLGDYFQYPNGGAEETFAESAAMHFGRDQSTAGQWPTLANYWKTFAAAHPAGAMMVRKPQAHKRKHAAHIDQIGHATLHADGSLTLDLRADGANGEIGHALLLYKPDHPQYKMIKQHVAPGEPDHPALTVARPGMAVKPKTFIVRPF